MAISNPKLWENFDSFGCLIGNRLPALNLEMAVKIGKGAFLFLLVLIWSNSLCMYAAMHILKPHKNIKSMF